MLYDDFSIPSRTILSAETKVMEVRGLSFADISGLLDHHREDIDRMIALWKGFDSEEMTQRDASSLLSEYGLQLLHNAPGIVANIIAVCADAPDQVDIIARLPVSVQVQAIEAIVDLTSNDFGGVAPMLGKIAGLAVANAPKAIKNQLEKLSFVSSNSTES